MILTQSFRAKQPKALLDDANRESGRIYTKTMATHWRIFRKHGIWLSKFNAMKLNDYLFPGTILHAHSRDAAQEAFYKASKTVNALKKSGNTEMRYPHRRKSYRTTIWKSTGIRVKDGTVLLARARGIDPIKVALPSKFTGIDIVEMRLVYNLKAQHYEWHMVVDDHLEKPLPPGTNTVAVDLGEIHPAAVCDSEQATVISARELRATHRRRNDSLSELEAAQSRCKKWSRRWYKLQRAKNKVKQHAERKICDINHKVSRAVVDFAFEHKASTIVIGDVRDIADGIDRGRTHNRRTSNWTHGQLRNYITYKAEMLGMSIALQEERYTSQTCPTCGNKRKQSGRVYQCHKCGWSGSRDGQVGAPNILSKYLFGEPARVQVQHLTYRHPFLTGKRKPVDTWQVARGVDSREAVGF